MSSESISDFTQDDNGAWIIWKFPAWQDFIQEQEEYDEDNPFSGLIVDLGHTENNAVPNELLTAQRAAWEYTKTNEEKIKDVILQDLHAFYLKYRKLEMKVLEDLYDFGEDGDFPELSSVKGLGRIFYFSGITLTDVVRDGIALVGYSFETELEAEHGIGVITCRDKVLGIGFADVAYSGDLSGCWTDDDFERRLEIEE